MTNISIESARALSIDILCRHNTSRDNAIHVAQALVSAEIDGQKGHGLSRIPSYTAQSASGKVNGRAQAKVVSRKGSAIRIDAEYGFAFPALDLAVNELVSMSAHSPVTSAAVFHSHHFGQAGYHVERLAQHGLVALILGNTPSAIAPWGGRKGLFGTNPIAFAAPRINELPLLIDLSLSKVARGKVMLAQQKGENIPEGWALDAQGKATTNPDDAMQGTMLPMGDAKGAALVMMVEILAAALCGANFASEASSFFSGEGEPPGVGQLIIVFDPHFFSDSSFSDRLEKMLAAILEQDKTRLPGDKRNLVREKAQSDGLDIPDALMKQLQKLKTG